MNKIDISRSSFAIRAKYSPSKKYENDPSNWKILNFIFNVKGRKCLTFSIYSRENWLRQAQKRH